MRIGAVLLAAVALYLGGYLALRVTTAEEWARDGRTYVLFPEAAPVLYYLYRPLSYVDETLTGTGAHVGPHREPAHG